MTTEATVLLQLFLIACLSVSNSSQSRQHGSTVVRGYRDYFSNPDCDSTICPNICPRYDARCSATTEDTYPCNNCYCRGEKKTYVGDGKHGGRCVSDQDLVKDSSKYLSTLICYVDNGCTSEDDLSVKIFGGSYIVNTYKMNYS